jgi:hypothetical protein
MVVGVKDLFNVNICMGSQGQNYAPNQDLAHPFHRNLQCDTSVLSALSTNVTILTRPVVSQGDNQTDARPTLQLVGDF